ncbi:MAG: tol-pal system-associated acyl-CoA thioesterase [Alphaproteobacteria bacterium]|nr:tol-pal system-associated acyl-CoA thioesterase [Alphaproteobacteria bacterium]
MTATPKAWPDLAGRLLIAGDGERSHVLPVRVYFEDTDFSGIVYHATYLRWCERGRSDFLRLLGNDHKALLDGGDGAPAAFVVRRMSLDFRRPARIDDVLEVATRVKALSAAVLELEQTVRRDTTTLFAADVQIVLVSLEGKPQRLSQRLRDVLGTGAP